MGHEKNLQFERARNREKKRLGKELWKVLRECEKKGRVKYLKRAAESGGTLVQKLRSEQRKKK